MEILFEPLKEELISLAFSFVLVFIAGIAFGYLSGVADRKTKAPRYAPRKHQLSGIPDFKHTPEPPSERPKTTSSIYDFNKKQ